MDILFNVIMIPILALLVMILFVLVFGMAYVGLCCLAGVDPERTLVAIKVKTFLKGVLKEQPKEDKQ